MNNMRKAIRISLIIILVYLLIFFIPHKMIQPKSNIQYIYCAFKGEYLALNDAQVNDILMTTYLKYICLLNNNLSM